MITITTKGKTYKVEKPEKSSFKIEALIYAWIESGVLEEVKEKQTGDKTSPLENHSILVKLRSELERRIESNRNGFNPDKNYRNILESVLCFLTSLENSSEIPNSSPISKMETTQFTPGQEDFLELPKINDTNLLEDVCVWTPKPGQEIEVSNDGEKWIRREFCKMDEYGYGYVCKHQENDVPNFQFARPIEDKIELPQLPKEFTITGPISETEHQMFQQISALTSGYLALTKSLNAVIRKLK